MIGKQKLEKVIQYDVLVKQSYFGAGFEVPEGASFEDDPIPLTKNEGHHADHHHQQEQRRQNGHDPQVAGRRLYHSYKHRDIIHQTLTVHSINSEQFSH